jgi:hypothetical protein
MLASVADGPCFRSGSHPGTLGEVLFWENFLHQLQFNYANPLAIRARCLRPSSAGLPDARLRPDFLLPVLAASAAA